MELKDVQKESSEGSVLTTIKLSLGDHKWLKDNDVVFTLLVRTAIRELREKSSI